MRLRSPVVAAAVLFALAPAACRSSSGKAAPEPQPGAKAAGLEQFVAGTGAVRLGMTEEEVGRALGSPPENRKETDRLVEAAYRIGGDVPGVAVARFLGGPLIVVEFFMTRVDDPPLPRVSRAVADSIAHDLALKAINHTLQPSNPPLEMADVLAATGAPGRRVALKLFQILDAGQRRTGTTTTWYWEVEPGRKVLIVADTDGVLEQPIIRDLPGP